MVIWVRRQARGTSAPVFVSTRVSWVDLLRLSYPDGSGPGRMAISLLAHQVPLLLWDWVVGSEGSRAQGLLLIIRCNGQVFCVCCMLFVHGALCAARTENVLVPC